MSEPCKGPHQLSLSFYFIGLKKIPEDSLIAEIISGKTDRADSMLVITTSPLLFWDFWKLVLFSHRMQMFAAP